MDEDDLKNFLTNKIENAINSDGGDASKLREFNFNRYYGKEYGNEREGHSSFTTREVFEAVEWAMPSIVKVFTSNDRAVEFLANNPEDEIRAKQETDIANHFIQVENNGYVLIHNWAKDILMNPTGYVKAYAEEKKQTTQNRFKGWTEEDLIQAINDPEIEVLEKNDYVKTIPNVGQIQLYEVLVRKTETVVKPQIKNIPAEEVLIDSSWNELILTDECPFIAHRVQKTLSDLVKLGYDAERLKTLSDSYSDNSMNSERVNRLFYEDENPDNADDSNDDSSKKFWVHEISVLVDYDGDNIAERRRVLMIGDEIFDNEPDNYQSIVSCASIIIPHKHLCMSYVEAVSDLQLLATTVTRELLDNVYSHTNKRHFFNEQALLENNETLDDYLDANSDVIIVKGAPQNAVMPEMTSPITGELLSVIQHVKEQPKLRTGVAPELSLNPDVLKQSTEGAFNNALDQASQRLDMLVRNIAEVGYKELMKKVHYILRTHINNDIDVKVRGSWAKFNPSEWPERFNMQVNVGLGHNSKNQKIQLLMNVLGFQKEALGQNLSDYSKIYKTLEKIIDAAGLGHGSSYFIDPSKPIGFNQQTNQPMPWQPPQPPPDANMIMAQAQAKALDMEQQRKFFEVEKNIELENEKLKLAFFEKNQINDQKLKMLELEYDKLLLSKEEFDNKYELEAEKALADIRNTNADTRNVDAKTEEIAKRIDKSDEYNE